MYQLSDRFGAATLVEAGQEKLLFDVGGVQRYGRSAAITREAVRVGARLAARRSAD
jgi:hypothetical protein